MIYKIITKYRLLLLLLPVLLVANTSYAQQKQGEIFVSNDYRGAGKDAIIVKWVANKLYYPAGFHVYRQEVGNADWKKLTAQPLTVSKTVPASDRAKDKDLKVLLDNVNQIQYAEFQESLIKVFAAIKSVISPRMAELLGTIYYDETAESGKSYTYKVVGLVGSKEEYINTTEQISIKPYQPTAAPKGVTIERKKGKIDINWIQEENLFYGVSIYRSINGSPFVNITESPRHLEKGANKKGEESYPDIAFTDLGLKDENKYEYKIAVVDYFGQTGTYTKTFSFNPQDFEAPVGPYHFEGKAHLLEVNLKWQTEKPDAIGFDIYRAHSKTEEMKKINTSVIPISDSTYQDKVSESGGYYYLVVAVDAAGNKGPSPVIFVDVHDLIPPCVPQDVFASTEQGKVNLSWKACTEEDLMGYYIYRSLNDGSNEDNEYILINKEPILTTNFTETMAEKIKNKFVYAIVSMDTNYNRSAYSKLSVVKLPDVTPPLAPFIDHLKVEEKQITVEWLPNHEEDLVSYAIYRSTYADSANYIKLGDVPSGNEVFVDESVVGGTYYRYYLTAIDDATNVSSISNIYEAKAYEGEELAAGDGNAVEELKLKVNKKKKTIKISWNEEGENKFIGGVLYRGNSPEELAPVSGLMKNENSFLDKHIKQNQTYYYQLRSYDAEGKKVKSDNYVIKTKKFKS